MTTTTEGGAGQSVWLIGGLDPSGGAGVLRDFAAVRAVEPTRQTHTVITTVTAQGDGLPATGTPVSAASLREQFARAPQPGAIKVGLTPAGLVEPLTKLLSTATAPIVVDPVLAATVGGALGATASGLTPLLSMATVLTPNLPELCQLSDASAATLRERLGIDALLVKGGHAPAEVTHVVDVLHLEGETRVFRRPRQGGPSPRGTGCALATVIACHLAGGCTVAEACARAIAWLDVARQQARRVGPQVVL